MGKGNVGALLLALSLVAIPACLFPPGSALPAAPEQRVTPSTWSIVAANPDSGAVGVAGASCFPEAVDAIAAVAPGWGAAATQADFDQGNRDRVFQLLQDGHDAEAIVGAMTVAGDDPGLLRRQYGVVTLAQRQVQAAAFTGNGTLSWAGERSDPERAVSVQGNLLEGEAVVAEALAAFRTAQDAGQPLAEQLMLALEAGAAAGGDRRCNTGQTLQTASAAFLMVARAGEAPYATPHLGDSGAGQAGAPSLYVSVTEPIGGENAVSLLREAYDAHLEAAQPPAPPRPAWRRPDVVLMAAAVVTLVAMGMVVVWMVGRRESGD